MKLHHGVLALLLVGCGGAIEGAPSAPVAAPEALTKFGIATVQKVESGATTEVRLSAADGSLLGRWITTVSSDEQEFSWAGHQLSVHLRGAEAVVTLDGQLVDPTQPSSESLDLVQVLDAVNASIGPGHIKAVSGRRCPSHCKWNFKCCGWNGCCSAPFICGWICGDCSYCDYF